MGNARITICLMAVLFCTSYVNGASPLVFQSQHYHVWGSYSYVYYYGDWDERGHTDGYNRASDSPISDSAGNCIYSSASLLSVAATSNLCNPPDLDLAPGQTSEAEASGDWVFTPQAEGCTLNMQFYFHPWSGGDEWGDGMELILIDVTTGQQIFNYNADSWNLICQGIDYGNEFENSIFFATVPLDLGHQYHMYAYVYSSANDIDRSNDVESEGYIQIETVVPEPPIYSGGIGTPADPYQIANVADFQQLSATPTDWDKSFILTADINLATLTFTQSPIAPDTVNGSNQEFLGTSFTGIFDGNGHVISHLTITTSDKDFIGLFGYVDSGGLIKNIRVDNIRINSGDYSYCAGGLCGRNYGTITNCSTTGVVSGEYAPYVQGGLCGENYGTIIKCYTAVEINGESYGSEFGGLMGYNEGTVTGCYATGTVSGLSEESMASDEFGGFCGLNRGTITDCYASGNVNIGSWTVGGFCGGNGGTIDNCYSTGLVAGFSEVGGFVGNNYDNELDTGILTDCFWDTQTSSKMVGVGSGTSTGVAGKTTIQMKILSTFTSANWDFSNTAGDPADWQMSDGNYPHLTWENQPSGSLQFKSSTYSVSEDDGSIRIYVSRTGGSYGSMSVNYVTANFTATAGSDYAAKSDTLNWSHGDVTDKYFDVSITNDNTIENEETFTVSLSGVNIGSPSQTTVTILKQIATYSGGIGTPADPYQIANVADFQQLSATPTDWDKSFILTADVNLIGLIFTQAPIAPDTSYISGFQGTMFTGVFDGNNHSISSLTITAPTQNYVGLFGYINNTSTIKNLGVVSNSNINGNFIVGGLVGYNNGTIASCDAGGASGEGIYIGGLVGYNNGTITSSSATGSVSGNSDGYGGGSGGSGGLVGYNSGTITSSSSTGSVSGNSDGYGGGSGGLVGENNGTITSCYSSGSVRGFHEVGGLVGENSGTITSCYSTGSVTGYCSDLGGLVGSNRENGTIISSYSTGSVTGDDYVGGLVGGNSGSISSCYSSGSVTGDDHVGGLVGANVGTIISSYSTGLVTGDDYVGGLVGYKGGAITSCFWDTQTSGTTYGEGSGITGKTTVQMQTLSTFTLANWDFTVTDGDPADWQMLLNHYPHLLWQTIVKDIADLNGDGSVDYLDLVILAEQWLQPSGNPSADLNNDNIVNFADFAIFAPHWMDGPPDLVGYWEFNETNGNQVYDSSTYGNHGTLMNGTVWTGNGELSFNGTNDYVSVPDSTSLDITNEITISAWIYMNQYSTNWPKLVMKPYDTADTDPWELFNLDLGHFGTYPRFILTDGIPGGNDITVSNSSYVLTLGQWHNIVGTYDGTTSSLYVDGELIASGSGVINIGTNDMPLNIGGRIGVHGFKGLIDEVRIYNRAVTLPEIELLSQSR